MHVWTHGRSIKRNGTILVLVPLSLGLVTLLTLTFLLHEAEVETERETHLRSMSSLSDKMSTLLFDGFQILSCYAFFKDSYFARAYDQIANEHIRVRTQLALMVSDQPDQVELLRQVGDLQVRMIANGRALCAVAQSPDMQIDNTSFLKQAGLMRQTQAILNQHERLMNKFRKTETLYAHSHLADSSAWRKRVQMLLVLAAIANIILSVVLTIFFSHSIRRRLESLRENAERLSQNKQLLPRMEGKDEIARLDAAFHHMARALSEATRKERAIISNALDVICSVNGERQFTSVSAGAQKVWGYEPGELVGHSIDTIVVADEDAISLNTPATTSTDLSFSFENRIKHKNGSFVNMLWSARWSATEKTYFCVAHDITDKKVVEDLLSDSESRLRTIMESMPVALLVTSESGSILAANQTAVQLLQYSSNEWLEQSISKVIPECQTGVADLCTLLEKLKIAPLARLDAVKGDGSTVPVQLSLSEYSYLGARYFLLAMQDMTQRHKMEVLKQEFVNTVSHDLKAPLLQVQSTLATLTNRPMLSEKGKNWVLRSEQEAERLVALVNELIEAQEVESPQVQLSKRINSLLTIVDRAIESVRPLAQKSMVKIENRSQDCSLLCNDARLIQVLVNLLSNAIKFSIAQGTITVESVIIGPWLELRIIDQGRGIPPSQLQSVFDRFVQVDKSDAKVGRGTGLGLTICKSIVEAHGGTIGVESEVGKGSTFWLRLPFSQA